MLQPAIIHKEALEKEFQKYYYTQDLYYTTGYSAIPSIETPDNSNGLVQYAIVEPVANGFDSVKIIGYLSYRLVTWTDTITDIILFSFDKGNLQIGIDAFKEMKKLITNHRKITWSCIGENPADQHYERMLKKLDNKKYTARKVRLEEDNRDINGDYHDTIIYEVLNHERKHYAFHTETVFTKL